MKCSLDISNFLEEISSLSCSVDFLYFFALITEEGFLISPCYSLELRIQVGISFLFPFLIFKCFFLELSCFLDDPVNFGNLISGCSTFSKTSLNIWKFTVHVLLKCSLENFEHLLCWCVGWVQLCGSLSILWHCLSLGLEWKLTFSNPVATAEFSKFAGILNAALSQHHLSGFEIAQLEFHHLL